jgi:putative DNA primase/helicase
MGKDKEIQTISFTKFGDADKKTAKVYDLVNGELIKSVGGNFWNGSFETINIPYTALPDIIKSMEAGEFIVQGVHQDLHSGNCPTDAARKKELFPFSNEAGLLIVDTDSLDMFDGVDSLDDLVAALVKIEPALESVMKFCSSSASSYVEYNGVNSGLRGVHAFIPNSSSIDNKTIIETFHIRCVNAGFSYPKITKSGRIKINSLVDTALKTSNQPVFEGGAILNHPAITQVPEFKLYEGGVLDVSNIKPLTDAERSKYVEAVERLNASVLNEANIIKSAFVSKKGSVIKGKTPSLSKKHSEIIIKHALNDNVLYGQFIIRLETGEEVTIQSILDNPKKYHLTSCSHPLDDDIVGKTLIYCDQPKPKIHTFAHGEEVFYLHPDLNPVPEKLHDSQIASYIAKTVKETLCYDPINKEWYVRDKGIWRIESEAKVIKLVNSQIELYIEGYNLSKQHSIISLLKQNIPAPVWETTTGLIPLLNGIYDSKTKALLEYSDEHNFCWQLPYEYNPLAPMPVTLQWLNTLGLSQNGIEEIRAFFHLVAVGDGARVQKFLELIGSGGTGKSTLIRLLIAFIGESNTTDTTLNELENNKFECSSFYGKRLVLISDAASYSESCENLKKSSGGDGLRFEEKHIRKAPSFVYHGFVVVVANQPLQSSDHTTGLSRRRFPILFNRVIKDEEKAKWDYLPEGIESAMHAELSGLFNWVMGVSEAEAIKRLRVETSGLSSSMRNHLLSTNKILAWIDDCLILSPTSVLLVGAKPIIPSNELPKKLYESYYFYCLENGIHPLNNNNFSKALQEAAISVQLDLKYARTSNGASYQGLAIRKENDKAIPTPITLSLLPSFEKIVSDANCVSFNVFDAFDSDSCPKTVTDVSDDSYESRKNILNYFKVETQCDVACGGSSVN